MLLHAVNKAILNNHLSKNNNSGVGSAADLNPKIDYIDFLQKMRKGEKLHPLSLSLFIPLLNLVDFQASFEL